MDYLINNYRSIKLGGSYFVTTDHGSHCILTEDEFRKLKSNKIDDVLKKKLEEKEIILNEENIDEAVRLTTKRNNFLFQGTSLHIIIITLRCDMKCIYCHASSREENEKKFDMDRETAKKTVDFIFQSPSRAIRIEFQGGEPMLNWNIIKYIVEYSKQKNREAKKDLMLSLVTNLSFMDEQKMNYLIEEGVDVCTSLDGPKQIHDYNRVSLKGSSYDTVTHWIRRFQDEYRKRGSIRKINALVTLTRKSLDYPEEIVDEYVKLGLNTIHLRFLNNLGVASRAWPKISYEPEKYLEFWKNAVRYIGDLSRNGKDIHEYMVDIMSRKIDMETDPNYLDLRSPCGAAIGQMAYNFNGDIYTCDEARMVGDDIFRLGNVNNDKYPDIVTCDKSCLVIDASINDQYICDNCAFKPYCGICPVCNYAEHGNIITKVSQTSRCRIFKEQFKWVVKEKFLNIKDS